MIRSSFMARARGRSLGATLALLLLVQIVCTSNPSLNWPQVAALIDTEFPTLPTLTTAELEDALSADRLVVLLDARAQDEFAVSHIRGARRADSVQEAMALLETADSDALVVAYCSVGYRSAALVQALRARGIEAFNLEGSIFRWANEERAVYRGAAAVREVHPFDDSWGTLLDPSLWAYGPRTTP